MGATKAVPVRLSEADIAALDAMAEREGCSRSALIVRFIAAGLTGGAVARAEAPQVVKEKPAPRPAPAVSQAQARGPAPKAGEATPYGVRGADGLTDKQRAVRALNTKEPPPPAYGSRLKRKPGRSF